jgi:hypothetical protein
MSPRRGVLPSAIALASLAAVVACSAPRVVIAPANPVRSTLEAQIVALPGDAPLLLRYNPAPCDCPAFELLLAERWLRAELVTSSSTDSLGRLLTWLGEQPPEQWPIAVYVRGGVDRDVVRTGQGAYAVRIEVVDVIEPTAALTAPTPQTPVVDRVNSVDDSDDAPPPNATPP